MTTAKPLVRQLPIAASAVLDTVLVDHRAALQKFRRHFRGHLGIDPHQGEVSVGRYGKVLLETTAVLPCLQTALRWSKDEAEVLCGAYRDAGLHSLVASTQYEEMLSLMKEALRKAVNADTEFDAPLVVKETLSKLVNDVPAVRSVTIEMERISDIVDGQLAQFQRWPGRLVRVEGPNAVVVVDRGEREDLEYVSAAFLRAVGIREEGDPFILNQLRWSPDTVSSVYIPAVVVDRGATVGAELADELQSAIRPLKFPM